MFRRVLFLALVLGGLIVPRAQAASDLAIVLNGNDNSLSTAGLPGGSSTLGVASFAGFPGEGIASGGRYYACVSGADRVVVFDLTTLAPLDTKAHCQ